jgi:T5orf172 domain
MPGDIIQRREPNQTVSESARIVSFYDLDPQEQFLKCVHLKVGSRTQRCGQPINKQDRESARGLFLKIRFSLTDATLLQDSLSTIAKLTLCNHVHRPRDGTEVLYTRMVQKWSYDFDSKQAAIGYQSVTDAVTDCNDPPENTISPGPDPAKSQIIHSEGLPLEATTSEDDHSLDGPATPVREKDILKENKDLALYGTRKGPYSGDGAMTMLPPQPLPKRVTRSGTLSQPDDEYLPYCPKLLTLNPSELVHCRNTALLSLLSRPLGVTAKKDGCVYIFTRPDDPSLVKIGFTKHSGKARVAAWGKDCCYAARLEFATEMMPHAWQVERLVQEQLKQYRKKERKCKWKASCSTQHQEWYEISVGEAQRVVEFWAGWITRYRPWGADGFLKPDWASLLNRYRIALKEPGCDADLWDRWARMEEPREASPVIPSPTLKAKPERHSSSTGIDNLDFDQASTSSTADQNGLNGSSKISQPPDFQTKNLKSSESDCSHTDSKIVLNLRLSISHLKSSKSFEIDCSSPLSSVPSPPASPTLLLRYGMRDSSHQASADALRAALKSALASLDASNCASSGGKGNHSLPQHTTGVCKKPMLWASGESEEGYCTA